MESVTETQSFWEGDLGYRHAIAVAVGGVVTGLFLHRLVGYGVPWGAMPLVWLAGLVTLAIPVVSRLRADDRVMLWLSGVPFAVTLTVTVCLMAILGGVVPQATIRERFGAPSVWGSWPFLVSLYLMTINLLSAVCRRAWPLSWANVTFLCSHLGLVVTLAGGAFSAITLERMTMTVRVGETSSAALDDRDRQHGLPFTLTLLEFTLETFPPTFALARAVGGEIELTPAPEFIKEGLRERVGSFRLEVLRFLPRAIMYRGSPQAVPWTNSAPAALVRATDVNGLTRDGWVSCGCPSSSAALLRLSEGTAVVMLEPRPRRFASRVEIRANSVVRTTTIEVNKPLRVAGYALYQLGYDEKMGTASEYSVIEVVRDRGIPVVYAGMGLLLLGSLLHLWTGVRQ